MEGHHHYHLTKCQAFCCDRESPKPSLFWESIVVGKLAREIAYPLALHGTNALVVSTSMDTLGACPVSISWCVIGGTSLPYWQSKSISLAGQYATITIHRTNFVKTQFAIKYQPIVMCLAWISHDLWIWLCLVNWDGRRGSFCVLSLTW